MLVFEACQLSDRAHYQHENFKKNTLLLYAYAKFFLG